MRLRRYRYHGRKSRRMLALERASGKPIETLIVQAYAQTGSMRGAARSLGISVATFWHWLDRLDIELRVIAVPRGAQSQSA